MAIKSVGPEDLKNLNNEGFTLLQMSAMWCLESRSIKSSINKIIDQDETLNVWIYNVDEDRSIAREFGVRMLPTLLFLKDNEVIAKKTGSITKKELQDWINLITKGEVLTSEN